MKYPKGTTVKEESKSITHGNRGMSLESDISITNEYYITMEKAFIYKKPTPIKIITVNYETMKITKAFFESPSTTDYNGLYKGNYIDFEAKETINKTSFPLKNIHKHQIQHMNNIMNHQGICFIIVRFSTRRENYLLFAKDFFDYLENNNKSSIPYTYFQEHGHLLEEGYQPRLDYLKIIEQYGGA